MFINTSKFTSSTYLNKKFGKKDVLKIGYNADYYIADLSDSITENDTLPGVYRTRWNANQAFVLIQSYIQWKHKFSDDFIFTVGIVVGIVFAGEYGHVQCTPHRVNVGTLGADSQIMWISCCTPSSACVLMKYKVCSFFKSAFDPLHYVCRDRRDNILPLVSYLLAKYPAGLLYIGSMVDARDGPTVSLLHVCCLGKAMQPS